MKALLLAILLPLSVLAEPVQTPGRDAQLPIPIETGDLALVPALLPVLESRGDYPWDPATKIAWYRWVPSTAGNFFFTTPGRTGDSTFTVSQIEGDGSLVPIPVSQQWSESQQTAFVENLSPSHDYLIKLEATPAHFGFSDSDPLVLGILKEEASSVGLGAVSSISRTTCRELDFGDQITYTFQSAEAGTYLLSVTGKARISSSDGVLKNGTPVMSGGAEGDWELELAASDQIQVTVEADFSDGPSIFHLSLVKINPVAHVSPVALQVGVPHHGLVSELASTPIGFTPPADGIYQFTIQQASDAEISVDLVDPANFALLGSASFEDQPYFPTGPQTEKFIFTGESGTPYNLYFFMNLFSANLGIWGAVQLHIEDVEPLDFADIALAKMGVEIDEFLVLNDPDEALLQDIEDSLTDILDASPHHLGATVAGGLLEFAKIRSDSSVTNLGAPLGATVTDSSIETFAYTLPDLDVLDGLPNFTGDPTTDDLIAILSQGTGPALDDFRDLLVAAVNANTTVSKIPTKENIVRIDQADALILIIALDNIRMLEDLLKTYELDVPLKSLVNLERGGNLNIDEIEGLNAALLSLKDNTTLASLRGRVAEANLHMTQAVLIAQNRPFQRGHLFIPGETVDGKTLVEAMDAVCKLDEAFSAPLDVGGVTVNLGAWVDSAQGLKELLPEFRDEGFVAFSATDPTLDGILPGVDHGGLNQLLSDASLLMQASGFPAWISDYIASGEVPWWLSLAEDDADGDGLDNMAEYLFALNPGEATPNTSIAIAGSVSQAGSDFLTITFTRRIAAADITYLIAASDDLENWDYSEEQIEQVGSTIPVGDGVGEIVTYRFKSTSSLTNRNYLRVHAAGR